MNDQIYCYRELP